MDMRVGNDEAEAMSVLTEAVWEGGDGSIVVVLAGQSSASTCVAEKVAELITISVNVSASDTGISRDGLGSNIVVDTARFDGFDAVTGAWKASLVAHLYSLQSLLYNIEGVIPALSMVARRSDNTSIMLLELAGGTNLTLDDVPVSIDTRMTLLNASNAVDALWDDVVYIKGAEDKGVLSVIFSRVEMQIPLESKSVGNGSSTTGLGRVETMDLYTESDPGSLHGEPPSRVQWHAGRSVYYVAGRRR